MDFMNRKGRVDIIKMLNTDLNLKPFLNNQKLFVGLV